MALLAVQVDVQSMELLVFFQAVLLLMYLDSFCYYCMQWTVPLVER